MAVYTKGFYSDPYCSENDAGKREKMCAKILQDAAGIGKSRRVGGRLTHSRSGLSNYIHAGFWSCHSCTLNNLKFTPATIVCRPDLMSSFRLCIHTIPDRVSLDNRSVVQPFQIGFQNALEYFFTPAIDIKLIFCPLAVEIF